MANKKTTTKKTASKPSPKASKKKTPKKSSAKKPAPAPKKAPKKAPTKKTSTKAATSKKSAPKKTSKSAPKKKPAAAKSTSKSTSKKAAAPAPSAAKKSAPKKPASKPAPKKKPATKKLTKAEAEAKAIAEKKKKAAEKKIAEAKAADAKKPGRKGITIVDNKPKRRSSSKPTKVFAPPPGIGLANTKRKPLIASGPKAPASQYSTFASDEPEPDVKKKKIKSPFNKRELKKFREILLEKRRKLAGDVKTMQQGVLSQGDKGGDPATDVAEQGSDAYDQSLSIGLAEVDRKLIQEIDDAIGRIDDGTFGICERTHEPINLKRLEELPWTRFSIQAAQELERSTPLL